jgi:hypothetical protein
MFVRERYSLVAAIVTIIIPPSWDICVVVERRKESINYPQPPLQVANNDAQG